MTDQASAASGIRERFASDFNALATQAEELLRTTAALSGDSVAAARDKFGESLARMREQLGSVEELARDSGKQALTATQTYVRENPWQAIGIGVLVGLTLGILATSSWRSGDREKQ